MEKVINKGMNINCSPYIRVDDTVTRVMMDVVLALIPVMAVSYLVYGFAPIMVIVTSVMSAVASEWLFSALFFKKFNSVKDLSAVVTGILLALTLAPFTPLYVTAFGASMGVVFGKLVYSGLGKNTFNPALVGREFMTVFFPAAMSGSGIWFNVEKLKIQDVKIFSAPLDSIIIKNSGAIGEYSIFLLVLGGIYLLIKDRISWHIPSALFTTVFLGFFIQIFIEGEINMSIGALMLGGIYMATDMPTSPSTPTGKIYYGIMTRVSITVFRLFGINMEVLSYSILTLNAFAALITEVFSPKVFGIPADRNKKIKEICFLTLGIITVIAVVIQLHYLKLVPNLVYIYIIYTTVKLIRSKSIK